MGQIRHPINGNRVKRDGERSERRHVVRIVPRTYLTCCTGKDNSVLPLKYMTMAYAWLLLRATLTNIGHVLCNVGQDINVCTLCVTNVADEHQIE